MKKVLLYSGGMDSWLISKICKPDVKLFVDMGTNSCKGELTRLDPDVTVIKMRDLGQFERTDTDFILPLRNLYLIALATNFGDHIILGANATDITLDKTSEFAYKLEDLLNYMYQPQKWTSGRQIQVDVSYRNYTKSQLLKQYLDNGGSVEEVYNSTFSCYTPENTTECHNCRPCFLKLMAFIDNDIKLPKNVLQSYLPYVESKLSQDIWTDRLYGREDYEKVRSLAK